MEASKLDYTNTFFTFENGNNIVNLEHNDCAKSHLQIAKRNPKSITLAWILQLQGFYNV